MLCCCDLLFVLWWMMVIEVGYELFEMVLLVWVMGIDSEIEGDLLLFDVLCVMVVGFDLEFVMWMLGCYVLVNCCVFGVWGGVWMIYK